MNELSGYSAELRRPASIKGWCRSKAIIIVKCNSQSLGEMVEYIELKCPYNKFEVEASNELARHICNAINGWV